MLFPADVLDAELRKLRGLLQMLHEDQPDVMEEVFDFHVTSLITHSAPDQHAHIRATARAMLAEVQRCPVRRNRDAPEILLMQALPSAA